MNKKYLSKCIIVEDLISGFFTFRYRVPNTSYCTYLAQTQVLIRTKGTITKGLASKLRFFGVLSATHMDLNLRSVICCGVGQVSLPVTCQAASLLARY
jgi:hypothetical protein